jgi:small subunit ribosomal protein S14
MAKQCMKRREIKRTMLVEKLAKKRAALKQVIAANTTSLEEKMQAQLSLQKLPRDSSPVRRTNRCSYTGRSRGVIQKMNASRNTVLGLARAGDIVGLSKGSW